VFDLSVNDAYNNPGMPVYQTKPNGETTVLRDGDWIYLSGRGASEKGYLPFLDKMNVRTIEKQRLFRSDDRSVEQFVAFAGTSRSTIITRYENRTEPPNYFIRELGAAGRSPLTAFKDPAPHMTGMKKELIT
jgi:dipeptidyl aminopeptidase/acylaminoacyl peptidase